MATAKAYMRNIRDKDTNVTSTMPSAASTTVNGSAIDMGAAGFAKAVDRSCGGKVDLVCDTPDFNTTMIPDTRTLTITFQTSDDSAFGSGNVDIATFVLTGADGAGVAATQLRAALPANAKRYVRAKYVSGASTTTMAAVTSTFGLAY